MSETDSMIVCMNFFPLNSVTCDITSLTKTKCHPLSKDHQVWLVDPLKFEVDLPQYKDDVFVAVISDLRENGFRLHDVYQQQQKPLNTSFDFVQPRRYIMIMMY